MNQARLLDMNLRNICSGISQLQLPLCSPVGIDYHAEL